MDTEEFLKERKRTRWIFNVSILIYPIIERNLFPQYRKALIELNLPSSKSVLDFATGTGILAQAFAERSHSVKGMDFSKQLLKRARKRFPDIEFQLQDLFELNEKTTERYDIVSIGYLLHGLSPDLRKVILNKAVQISKYYVLIFDHNSEGNWIVDLIEWLEGSHYKQFVKENRHETFSAAGLKIVNDFRTSDYGHVWLCEKI
jgi:ubiquinone/menaquinone biosynthesis C-methylase UbiE